jgi:hypothetical protein
MAATEGNRVELATASHDPLGYLRLARAALSVIEGESMKETHTKPRSVRVPDPLWQAAKDKAAERGETVTDVVVKALERYVKR